MKKFLFNHKEFLIGFLLTLSLLWPLFAASFFTHHDDVQVIRLYEMDKCFKDHQIPCRWVPDLGGLYGYPIFNYYAPLPYYFGEIIFFLTHNLIWSVKIMFAVSFLGSYVFMYLLTKKLWGKLGGILSASLYTFAPYHAVDFYIRGAMGEMWALMFFPFIFWALLKLEENISVKNLLLSCIAISGFLVSHNLSVMIFLPFTIIWIFLLFLRKKVKKFLVFCFFSFLLAFILSAFYVLPLVFEKNLVHVETTTYGYFSYTEHFKGLRKLFLDNNWSYGSSIREVPGGEKDKLPYQIGWVHLFGWVLAIFIAKILWNKNRWISTIIIFASASIVISIFMIHPRSEFVWKLIPDLKYLQFPWRFLLLIIFFISFISGSFALSTFKYRKFFIWIILFAAVALNFSHFRPEKFIQTNDQQLLTGANWDKQIKRSIFDYLPIYAKEPPAELADKQVEILTGETAIFDFKQGSNWISFKTDTKTHSIIRLSQYYFPDWKVFVDGKEISIDYKNNTLGLMTFILGKGNHQVSARLFDTPVRSISNLLTLISFAVSGFLFLISFGRVRQWVAYYRKRIN